MADGKKLRVRNWERFQHYKDRRPPWIKLHTALLDDYDFGLLDDQQKWHLIGIWILASSCDNRIQHNARWVGRRINASEDVDLDALVEGGWLEFAEGEEPRAEWSSRYVSKKVRAAVLERDGHKCCACGSPNRLEIDHIVPVSKGGTGAEGNLQTLCRSCNRKKRARSDDHRNDNGGLRGSADAEQVATDVRSDTLRSGGALARSREAEAEAEPLSRDAREAGTPEQGFQPSDQEDAPDWPLPSHGDAGRRWLDGLAERWHVSHPFSHGVDVTLRLTFQRQLRVMATEYPGGFESGVKQHLGEKTWDLREPNGAAEIGKVGPIVELRKLAKFHHHRVTVAKANA